jgi:Ca2+-binding EF-hand superfamily protein
MKIKFLAFFVVLLGWALFLGGTADSLGQFRGGPGGKSSGFGGGGFGGFSGPGSSIYFLQKDPQGLFDKMAKGRDHFLISETFSLRADLTQFAKDQGITNDKVTKDQFMLFADKQKAKLPPSPDVPAASSIPGTPPSPAPSGKTETPDNEMALRTEYEFRRRDNNSDGFLNTDEMSDSLRQDLGRWDKNNDRVIDLNEYKEYFQTRYQQRGDGERSNQGMIVNEIIEDDTERRPVVLRAGKLPKELEALFKELDGDQDGQIDMAEWRSAGKTLGEFRIMDFNEDGLLIPEEVIRHQTRPATAMNTDSESKGKGFSGFGNGSSRFGGGGPRPDGGSGGGPPWMRFKKPGN